MSSRVINVAIMTLSARQEAIHGAKCCDGGGHPVKFGTPPSVLKTENTREVPMSETGTISIRCLLCLALGVHQQHIPSLGDQTGRCQLSQRKDLYPTSVKSLTALAGRRDNQSVSSEVCLLRGRAICRIVKDNWGRR
jgi:hypothetical protein